MVITIKSIERRNQLRTQLANIVGASESIGEILVPIRRGKGVHRNVSMNGHGPEFVYQSNAGGITAVYEHEGTLYQIQITKTQKSQ